MTPMPSAILEINLNIAPADRPAAAEIYTKYKQAFLSSINGAMTKRLLVRDEDVQVLHGFASVGQAQAYLTSDLFMRDVVKALAPLLKADPDVRIYAAS